jgi:NhaP-type Na+/H+ or K+/H+ antiporter
VFPPASQIGLTGWYHLVVMGVLLPALVVRNYRRMIGRSLPLPNRLRHFRGTAIMLVILTLFSVLVAEVEWIELFRFDSAKLPQGLAAGALMYVLTVAFMRPRWRKAVKQRSRIVSLFMPDTPTERAW